jgi:hypothetical protein
MPLCLRDQVHWCNCEGRAVFLDIRADRYFCLPKTSNDAFLRLAARRMQPSDKDLLDALVARGLLIETKWNGGIQPAPMIDTPTHDLADERRHSAPILWILRSLAAELGAAWRLRTRGFEDAIEAARNRVQRTTADNASPALKKIVSAAAAAALVTRSHDRCLVRALAVQALCARAGIKAELVFGVTAHPFAAHSWVQLGSAVLVGGFEQARLYTPILIIR